MKVLEALASAIAAEGVDHVFAVMGDANQDIIVELCEKHGLKYIHAHHETSAVGMADGYSRFTGKIGLATTTQGPGVDKAPALQNNLSRSGSANAPSSRPSPRTAGRRSTQRLACTLPVSAACEERAATTATVFAALPASAA
jgi:hypothetical protein